MPEGGIEVCPFGVPGPAEIKAEASKQLADRIQQMKTDMSKRKPCGCRKNLVPNT